MEGRFSIIIPGAISQYTFPSGKRSKGAVLFVTYAGAFITKYDASLVEIFNISSAELSPLSAEIATPLLDILGTSENAFYNVKDLNPEFHDKLYASSGVTLWIDYEKKRAIMYEQKRKQEIDDSLLEYEHDRKRKIDERLNEYEEELKLRIQRLQFRMETRETKE